MSLLGLFDFWRRWPLSFVSKSNLFIYESHFNVDFSPAILEFCSQENEYGQADWRTSRIHSPAQLIVGRNTKESAQLICTHQTSKQTAKMFNSLCTTKVVFVDLYSAYVNKPLVRSWDHLSYGITQCYLPPDRGDYHTFTRAYCRYSFIDPGRMKGWVDLGG